jgi:hypothetical protein
MRQPDDRPRLVDLCCGGGGATKGYQRAGFYVVGVDVKPQPNYCGDEFYQADALEFPLDGFDAVHASPPCQRYIRGGLSNKARHPDLLGPIRERLEASGLPWVIENVPGAPMRPDVVLCGSMFGLEVRRHRWFESNAGLLPWTLSCDHSRPVAGVYGHSHGKRGAWPGMLSDNHEVWSRAMGIDWMTSAELADAIPPAYTQLIGADLLRYMSEAAA